MTKEEVGEFPEFWIVLPEDNSGLRQKFFDQETANDQAVWMSLMSHRGHRVFVLHAELRVQRSVEEGSEELFYDVAVMPEEREGE